MFARKRDLPEAYYTLAKTTEVVQLTTQYDLHIYLATLSQVISTSFSDAEKLGRVTENDAVYWNKVFYSYTSKMYWPVKKVKTHIDNFINMAQTLSVLGEMKYSNAADPATVNLVEVTNYLEQELRLTHREMNQAMIKHNNGRSGSDSAPESTTRSSHRTGRASASNKITKFEQSDINERRDRFIAKLSELTVTNAPSTPKTYPKMGTLVKRLPKKVQKSVMLSPNQKLSNFATQSSSPANARRSLNPSSKLVFIEEDEDALSEEEELPAKEGLSGDEASSKKKAQSEDEAQSEEEAPLGEQSLSGAIRKDQEKAEESKYMQNLASSSNFNMGTSTPPPDSNNKFIFQGFGVPQTPKKTCTARLSRSFNKSLNSLYLEDTIFEEGEDEPEERPSSRLSHNYDPEQTPTPSPEKNAESTSSSSDFKPVEQDILPANDPAENLDESFIEEVEEESSDEQEYDEFASGSSKVFDGESQNPIVRPLFHQRSSTPTDSGNNAEQFSIPHLNLSPIDHALYKSDKESPDSDTTPTGSPKPFQFKGGHAFFKTPIVGSEPMLKNSPVRRNLQSHALQAPESPGKTLRTVSQVLSESLLELNTVGKGMKDDRFRMNNPIVPERDLLAEMLAPEKVFEKPLVSFADDGTEFRARIAMLANPTVEEETFFECMTSQPDMPDDTSANLNTAFDNQPFDDGSNMSAIVVEPPSVLEESFELVKDGLSLIARQMGLIKKEEELPETEENKAKLSDEAPEPDDQLACSHCNLSRCPMDHYTAPEPAPKRNIDDFLAHFPN